MENRSESIVELAKALSKAQGMIKGAVKGSENPYFRSTYADLASVWEACREPLSKNGLSIIQTTEIIGINPVLRTILLHDSGEWIAGIYPIMPMRQAKDTGWVASEDPQSMGSAVTYARRYTLAAMVGIAPEDDDGEAAMGRKPEAKNPPQKLQQPKSNISTLSFDSAMKRMGEIQNIFELKAWWTKHFPEVKAMGEAEQAELTAYKDHLKAGFEEKEKESAQ